ncbi:porin [Rhodoferax ferrireducens]|uniref:porin n=1 Tax=Rhodoferax ferrireducens TaxID=192843 RepID=UPI001300AAAC|nr:porin [Rhodoferax ferrireducens]
MKKTLQHTLLGALAVASAAASAQSSVRLSGVLDEYVTSRQLSGALTRLTKLDSGGMTTSQLTFDGSEDLGGGLKADFTLSMFLRADTGEQGRFAADPLFARASWMGLSGNVGSVRLGRHPTAAFLNYVRTNAFGDSPAFGPAFLHTWVNPVGQGTQFLTPAAATGRSLTAPLAGTDNAWNNAVTYLSPNLGGVTFTAQWAPSESNGVGNRADAGVYYVSGPLVLAMAREQFGKGNAPATTPATALNKMTNWSGNAAYTFGFGRLSAGFLSTKRDYATLSDDKFTTIHVGASVPLGAGNVLWQTARSRQTGGVSSTRLTTSVGYDYVFSKRTDLYSVVMNDKLTNNSSGNTLAMGIRHRF